MSVPGYRKVGFSAGLRWLPAAADILRSGFRPLAGLAALWLLVSLIALIPLVGQLVMMLITPLLTAGAIAAFAQVTAGGLPRPAILFAAWGRAGLRNRLLAVGVFGVLGAVLALMVVAMWLSGQVTPEQIQAAQQSIEAMAAMLEQLTAGPLLLLAAGIVAVVMAAVYFAIPLLMFHDISTAGALALSLRAALANWAALLGFGVAAVVLMVALGFVFSIIAMIFSLALGAAAVMILQILFMLAAMLIQVLLAGTQWVAFADIFGAPGNNRGRDRNQLLA